MFVVVPCPTTKLSQPYVFIYLRPGPHNPSSLFGHAHFFDAGRERRHKVPTPTIPLSLHRPALTATVVKAARGIKRGAHGDRVATAEGERKKEGMVWGEKKGRYD